MFVVVCAYVCVCVTLRILIMCRHVSPVQSYTRRKNAALCAKLSYLSHHVIDLWISVVVSRQAGVDMPGFLFNKH